MNTPYQQPINHRIARTLTGATVALSALWAGVVVFGPVSDERTLRLAGAAPVASVSAQPAKKTALSRVVARLRARLASSVAI